MAKKNEASLKFKADTSELNDKIKKSKDEMSQLRAELKLNETQMKATGNTVEGLENQHKLLSAQLSASEDKTNALSQKVEKAVEIFGENSDEAKKLKKDLLYAQVEQEKLAQAVDKCNKSLDDQRAAEKVAETATQKLTDQIDKQQDEVDKLKKSYVEAVLKFGDTSDEARDLANQIEKLSGELRDSKSEFSKASDMADELDKSLEELTESAEETTDGFTVMKGAVANLVADGIKSVTGGLMDIGKEAISMSNDVTKGTNTFITKTGLSVEAAENFEDVMLDIYRNNFGDDFEDIAQSMATVRNNLGAMDNGTLQILTEDAILLRDTFDFDVNESTRTASMLMRQFGIDGETAYSLIATGAQYGLDKNGDLLDTLNEYAVHYQQLGYGVDDMLNMLVNGTASGTFSVDKLGDAVKEFGIRAKDASDTSIDAFDTIGLDAATMIDAFNQGGEAAREATEKTIDALFNMDNKIQQNQAGVALFGTMWEDLGADGVAALMDVNNEITISKDTLNTLNEVKYDDIGSAIEGIKRNLETSISEPINDEVLPVINEMINDIDWQGFGQSVSDIFGKIVEGAGKMAEGIRDTVEWIKQLKESQENFDWNALGQRGGEWLENIFTNIDFGKISAIISDGIKGVLGIISGFIDGVNWSELGNKIWTGLIDIVQSIDWIGLIGKALELIFNVLKGSIEFISGFFKGLLESISNVISDVVSFVMDNIVRFFKNALSWIENNWQGLLLIIVNPFAGAFKLVYDNCEGFRTKVDDFIVKVKEVFRSGFETVKTNIIDPIRNAKDNALSAIENLKTNVSNKITTLKSSVSTTFDKIKSAIITPIQKARDQVKTVVDAIKGFFSGMKLSLPHIKLPHFKLSGSLSLSPPSVPKLNIEWYKDGAILTRPTIFGMNGLNPMVGGEAGYEAILPIAKLEDYITNSIEKTMNVVDFSNLAAAIQNMADRPIYLNVNGRTVAQATAGDLDSVNGLRNVLSSRGLVLD